LTWAFGRSRRSAFAGKCTEGHREAPLGSALVPFSPAEWELADSVAGIWRANVTLGNDSAVSRQRTQRRTGTDSRLGRHDASTISSDVWRSRRTGQMTSMSPAVRGRWPAGVSRRTSTQGWTDRPSRFRLDHRHQASQVGVDQREREKKRRPSPSSCISRRSSRLRRSGVGNHPGTSTGDRPPTAYPEEATAVIIRLGDPQPTGARRTPRPQSATQSHRPRWNVCDTLLFYFEASELSA
jgi:hypothetical protein